MYLFVPSEANTQSMNENFWNGLRSYSEPLCDINETSASASEVLRLTALLVLEEPFPPPKPFDRCLRSKAQRRLISKIVLEISGDGYRIRSSFQAPTTRSVHNRNIGHTLLEAERKGHLLPIQGNRVQQTTELDILLKEIKKH